MLLNSSDDNIFNKSYRKKNKRVFSLYDFHLRKTQNFQDKESKENNYDYVNNRKKFDLLLNFEIEQVDRNKIKKLRDEEFRKTIISSDKGKNCSSSMINFKMKNIVNNG